MTLFDGMVARVDRRARDVVERTRRLAEVAVAEFPDVMLHREGDEIIVSGRGLMHRWLGDVRLRFALWGTR